MVARRGERIGKQTYNGDTSVAVTAMLSTMLSAWIAVFELHTSGIFGAIYYVENLTRMECICLVVVYLLDSSLIKPTTMIQCTWN